MTSKLFITFIFLFGYFNCAHSDFAFELSLIHLNDFHDRIDEINVDSSPCSVENCIGGISRISTAINQLTNSRPNPIVLNAGDNFHGTVWYNFYKWNATQHFLNLIHTDVYTLGNHEFDDGVEGVVPFLKALKSPIVVCNINDTNEPRLQGLYNKSIVIERAGKRIGIIGVVTARTGEKFHNENFSFRNEIESVNAEAQRLDREGNVDTIIVLSHCGYFKDKLLAEKAGPKISVIVGGHSHTLLYNGEPPGNYISEGPYPTVVDHEDGRTILVVQASAYGKFLGNLTVQYDSNSGIFAWSGAPIYLNGSIPQDEVINSEVQLWKDIMQNETQPSIIGETKVFLERNCIMSECNIGNLVADAMVSSYLNTDEGDAWTYAAIAVVNSGSIRSSIFKGNISTDHVSVLNSFQNTVDVVKMKGKNLKKLLEFGAGHHNNTSSLKIKLLQVSGIHVVYNFSRPIGSRVVKLQVRCRECDVPRYEPVKRHNNYRIIMNSFMVAGKAGYKDFLPYMEVLKVGDLDVNVVSNYIKKHSPIVSEIEGRIKVLW